jgi:tubulin polyglutamylase TTLL1
MDPYKRVNCFEIFGLDFMFDEQFRPYLIEVNTNPCLELPCPLLSRLLPAMLENSLRLVVDPLYLPPENFSQKKNQPSELCPLNNYELIFDEREETEMFEIIKKMQVVNVAGITDDAEAECE